MTTGDHAQPLVHRPPTRAPFRPGEMAPVFGDTAATLIVDDDPATAAVLARILEIEGYDCTVAASAVEARARLDERRYALALVDVLMPGESGLELVVDLIARSPHLAVIMVTGVDEPAIAELAMQGGAYGYLVKPIDANQLVVAAAYAGARRCAEIERDLYERRLERHADDQEADLEELRAELKDHRRAALGD